jgi:hypothetical protein
MKKVAKNGRKFKAKALFFYHRNGRKVKAICLTFLPSFFAPFSKMKRVAKNGRKVKAITLFFTIFAPFLEMKKVAKNGRKVKAIALFFYYFLPLFPKMKKWLKMDTTLRLYPYYSTIFSPFFNNEKVAKNGRNVKAIALFFYHFLPLFQK